MGPNLISIKRFGMQGILTVVIIQVIQYISPLPADRKRKRRDYANPMIIHYNSQTPRTHLEIRAVVDSSVRSPHVQGLVLSSEQQDGFAPHLWGFFSEDNLSLGSPRFETVGFLLVVVARSSSSERKMGPRCRR